MSLKDSHRHFYSSEVLSVWYRRPKPLAIKHSKAEIKNYISIQGTASLRGLYFCTHDEALWINPLTSLHRARIKLQQLQSAVRIGFDVPQTIVSNVPEVILNFFDKTKIICIKSLDEPNFELDGSIYPMLTRLVTNRKELSDNTHSLRLCPTLFQEYIEKKYDIRVVVIGDKIFAFEIDSQKHELSTHDFRGIAPRYLNHSVHQLPVDILKKIKAFMNHQKLFYSALDFVLTPKDQYFFLENNPNGQWLWLEDITGVNISDCLIENLVDPKREENHK